MFRRSMLLGFIPPGWLHAVGCVNHSIGHGRHGLPNSSQGTALIRSLGHRDASDPGLAVPSLRRGSLRLTGVLI